MMQYRLDYPQMTSMSSQRNVRKEMAEKWVLKVVMMRELERLADIRLNWL